MDNYVRNCHETNHRANLYKKWDSITLQNDLNTCISLLGSTNTDPKEVEQMRLEVLAVVAPLIAERKIAKMKALQDEHDASTLVMGSNTSVLQGQHMGDADVIETQANGMQGLEHPHRSGDETGSSEESERSTETHANSSGYEQDSKAPGSST